ncbi:MAG: hypothetical protein ACP5QZ_04770 [Candidatus Sumerlaeaceae bacterium]
MTFAKIKFGRFWPKIMRRALFVALASVAGAFHCLCPACAASTECGAADVQFRGVDLSRVKWFVSSELSPSASADQVTSRAKPIPPIKLLSVGNAEFLTLFTLVEVPGQSSFGALLTIGDLDGDDETYFNGQIVGKTSGRGISDLGVPRTYYIPPTAFVEGRNVLAIKLRGCFRRSQVGIRREPLTLAFVPRPPQALELPIRPAVASAIATHEALAAVVAADPEASGSLILNKRPGFGRFGLFFSDGLPAVTEVGPTGVQNRFPPEFRVRLDAVTNVEIARDKTDAGIDAWHKALRVQGNYQGAQIRYSVRSHVFYPGAVFQLEEGDALVLRVSGEQPVSALRIPPATLASVLGVPAIAEGEAYLFVSRKGKTCPALTLITDGAGNLTEKDGAVDLAVGRVGKSKKPPRLHVVYPFGIRVREVLGAEQSWQSIVAALADVPPTEASQTLQSWLRLGLWFPTATDEYFRVSPDLNFVRIYQLTRFESPIPLPADFSPYLVLPPQVNFVQKALGYPARTPETTATGVVTFTGPLFAQARGVSAILAAGGKKKIAPTLRTSSPLHVWHYDLPVPPLDERGLLAVPGQPELKALLNESCSELATTITAPGVDVLYKGRTQAFQAYSFLTPDLREKLVANTRAILPAYLQRDLWYDSVEPFSGLRFWWSYFIEGPYFDRYDQDWGNGLSLYGLYTSVKYLGEWEWVAKNWQAVERMFSWFAVTDDWEWLRASNGVHGHGTGAGDCTNATYAGMLAYAKLARETGRTEEFLYGLYAAARAAVPAVSRFAYNEYAQELGLLQASSRLVVGFHEGEGFLAGELDRYPWNVTSLISGNGVQPELFDLLRKYAEAAVTRYVRIFDAAYPNWDEGAYRYPFRTIYRNNSGYITLPQIYLRVRMNLDGPEQAHERVERARVNREFWWLAPPVLAEVMQPLRAKVYLANWGKCAFLGGSILPLEKGRMKIEAQFDNRYPPDTVEFVLPRPMRSLEINDAPVPIPDIQRDGLRLRVRLRKPGINLLTVLL